MSDKTTPNESKSQPNLQSDKEKWPETIRDLIKQENDLFTSRIGWTGTFQGLLFTAFTFIWDKGLGVFNVLMPVCLVGLLQAVISLTASIQARIAICRLLKKWRHYNSNSSKIELPNSSKIELPNSSKIELPVWGWVKITPKTWPPVLMTSFGVFIPLILLCFWVYWIYYIQFLKDNDPVWVTVAQKNLEQALSHDKPDNEIKQAITTLARIHGNVDKGAKVFGNACADCHGEPKLDLKRVDTTDDLVSEGRNSVIVALVGINLYIRIFDGAGKVFNRKENELENEHIVGDIVGKLKELLNTPLIIHVPVSQEKKEEIIQDAITITHYTQSCDETIPKADELKMYPRENIMEGILYPNSHKNKKLRCNEDSKQVTCMRNDVTSSMTPKEFIDLVEYLKEPKPKWTAHPPSDNRQPPQPHGTCMKSESVFEGPLIDTDHPRWPNAPGQTAEDRAYEDGRALEWFTLAIKPQCSLILNFQTPSKANRKHASAKQRYCPNCRCRLRK